LRVAILSADSYTAALETTITDGLPLFDLNLRGSTVLLKPNLVESIPGQVRSAGWQSAFAPAYGSELVVIHVYRNNEWKTLEIKEEPEERKADSREIRRYQGL
jgi:hypothetical protein